MAIEISYRDLWNHGSMLQDEVRCKAFRDALFEVVTPDSVVLDIGAGTGILSIFAAQAGAEKVYAVERTPVAQAAREIIESNGLSDRITVIQGEMESLELPEKVDVIVSEWLGGYGVDENLLPIVIQARDLSKTDLKNRPAKGYISFQDEAKRIWYRKVRIKELP